MRPSSSEIINGIKWSLETYILPDLRDPLAQSAGRSIVGLLDHLRLRVANECKLLAEDNSEKKQLFLETAQLLEAATEESIPGIQELLAEMYGKASASLDAFPSVQSLNEENDSLKSTLYRLIQTMDGNKDKLPEDLYARADQAIRVQLRRQLERENSWIEEAFSGKPRF